MIDENEGFDYQVMPREEERTNKPIWQSYVYHEGKCFFVSTIERTFDIPAAGGSVRGLETLAWECDPETKVRGEAMIFHGEGLLDHINACRGLIKIGRLT